MIFEASSLYFNVIIIAYRCRWIKDVIAQLLRLRYNSRKTIALLISPC